MQPDSCACLTCVWHIGSMTCVAFPDGIPAPIFDGRNDHTEPYPGDRGIQYTPADGGG